MRLSLAVHRLVPDAEYTDASTYELLTTTWYDARPLPSLQALEAAWALIVEDEQNRALDESARNTVKSEAEANARQIPTWASMSEQEAITYIQTNVTDLASARTVLIALARMVVHLRDAQWPQFRG